jgi:hypothetical protein
MKTLLLSTTILLTVVSAGVAAPRLKKQTASSTRVPTQTSLDPALIGHAVVPQASSFQDTMFDYDLYVADPSTSTGFYIVWTYSGGVVRYSSPFTNYDNANDWLIWSLFHGVDPRNSISDPDLPWPDAKIMELPKEPNWVLYDSYGTQSQAVAEAEWFEDFGMLTKITARSVVTLKTVVR